MTLAGDLSDDRLVEEVLEDGRLVIRPDVGADANHRRFGVEPVSREEFEPAFQDDLGHATARGREDAIETREPLERDGADPAELLRRQAEHREGTELPNCVKVYLPPPDGQWGMGSPRSAT